MGRSTNTYPPYQKLDFDKNTPPKGWMIGVRRCMECKKDWPNLPEFSPSPCCNTQAGIVSDGVPEMSWVDAFNSLVHVKFDRWYEKWNEGASDIELEWNLFDDVSDELMNEGLEEIENLIHLTETNGTISET